VLVRRGITNLVEEALLFSTISEWEGRTSHKVFYSGLFTNRLGLFYLFISLNIIPMMKMQRKWNLFIGG
jgi:hypothetical protein